MEEDAGGGMGGFRQKQDREHRVSEGCEQKKTREKERKGGRWKREEKREEERRCMKQRRNFSCPLNSLARIW